MLCENKIYLWTKILQYAETRVAEKRPREEKLYLWLSKDEKVQTWIFAVTSLEVQKLTLV